MAAYALARDDVEIARDAAREALALLTTSEEVLNYAYALQHLATVAAARRRNRLVGPLLGAANSL